MQYQSSRQRLYYICVSETGRSCRTLSYLITNAAPSKGNASCCSGVFGHDPSESLPVCPTIQTVCLNE